MSWQLGLTILAGWAVIPALAWALAHEVMRLIHRARPHRFRVSGVFQLSHSFSYRPARQEKPDPQFLPIHFY